MYRPTGAVWGSKPSCADILRPHLTMLAGPIRARRPGAGITPRLEGVARESGLSQGEALECYGYEGASSSLDILGCCRDAACRVWAPKEPELSPLEAAFSGPWSFYILCNGGPGPRPFAAGCRWLRRSHRNLARGERFLRTPGTNAIRRNPAPAGREKSSWDHLADPVIAAVVSVKEQSLRLQLITVSLEIPPAAVRGGMVC